MSGKLLKSNAASASVKAGRERNAPSALRQNAGTRREERENCVVDRRLVKCSIFATK